MKFQQIDHLAQSVDKLPDIADLGDRYVYHCLREVYDRYLAGKLEKEEAEAERRKLYQAHRLYREQEAAHLKAHKQIQEAIRQAGELQSEIYKGLGVLPADELLEALLPVYQRHDRGGHPHPKVRETLRRKRR